MAFPEMNLGYLFTINQANAVHQLREVIFTEGSYGINFLKDDNVGGNAEQGLRYALDPGTSALVVLIYSEVHVNLRIKAATENPIPNKEELM